MTLLILWIFILWRFYKNLFSGNFQEGKRKCLIKRKNIINLKLNPISEAGCNFATEINFWIYGKTPDCQFQIKFKFSIKLSNLRQIILSKYALYIIVCVSGCDIFLRSIVFFIVLTNKIIFRPISNKVHIIIKLTTNYTLQICFIYCYI